MFSAWTPQGAHDLHAAVEAARIEPRFDAVVVWADASGINLPLNLDAFDCPKVLCSGDTHHLKAPLRAMIDYAKNAKYDAIVSSHNRHHLHWFAQSGFTKLAWLPGLKVKHTPRPFASVRKPALVFAGNATAYHARRARLMEALRRASVPFGVTRAPRESTADIFASSLASFNASLNGDLNLRVFEILSSGGCLFTDRLAPESGMPLILEDGKDFIGYDTVEECVEQARFILTHPDTALGIARAGNRAFVERMLPERRAGQLLDWIFEDRLDSLFRIETASTVAPDDLDNRLRVYEELQELHRIHERPAILFMDDVPDIHREDARDLKRLDIQMERCLPRSRMEHTDWDGVIARKTANRQPHIRARHRIAL
jgi:hypothetical protein